MSINGTASSSSIEQFDLSYKGSSFSQREVHFRALNSGEARVWLAEYVRRFPFNTQMWNTYAQHVKTSSIEAAEKVFAQGVAANPRSYDLWHSYLSFVRSELQADEEKTLHLYEQALEQIGLDYNSSIYWEDLIRLQNENKFATFKLYQHALEIPTKNFDDLLEKFSGFFTYCTPDDINSCWESMFSQEVQNAGALSQSEKIQMINTEITQVALRTKSILPQVAQFEAQVNKAAYIVLIKLYEKYIWQLSNSEYVGSGSKDERDTWAKYFTFAKEQLSADHLIFLYEKALIPNCDKDDIWVQYFSHLDEWNAQPHKGYSFCVKYMDFFRNLNSEVVFFQLAEVFELSGDDDNARLMYQNMIADKDEKSSNYLRVLNRWIQFEKRVQTPLEAIVQLYNKVLENDGSSSEMKQWAVNELARLYAFNGRKTEGLVRFIEFFEELPVTRVGFAALLSFFTDEFQKEPGFFEVVADLSRQAIQEASANEVQAVANLAVSQIRSVVYDVHNLRRLEQEVRQAEQSARKNQNSDEWESLLKKRSLSQLLGDVDTASNLHAPQKHFKSN